jgi:cell division protein FtsZ
MENNILSRRVAVIGVGGGGGNALNNMVDKIDRDVRLIVANTDAQALAASKAEHKVQLGRSAMQGLGAGSIPELGQLAATESIDEIMTHLHDVQVCFLAAGMGGGTGTGAAPVIAKAARQVGILTIAIVTEPFTFEGAHRARQAKNGIEKLLEAADTVIVVPNQNLFFLSDATTTLDDAFAMSDKVLNEAVLSLLNLMTTEGLINLDFADVQSVMKGMGRAVMATGSAAGLGRASEAARAAIENPLFRGTSLRDAKSLLMSVSASRALTLFEVDEAASYVRKLTNEDAEMVLGASFDQGLGDCLRVSIIASGLNPNGDVVMLADHIQRRPQARGTAL